MELCGMEQLMEHCTAGSGVSRSGLKPKRPNSSGRDQCWQSVTAGVFGLRAEGVWLWRAGAVGLGVAAWPLSSPHLRGCCWSESLD